MSSHDLGRSLRALVTEGSFPSAPPGAGATPARMSALFAIAKDDLELARLAEAHADAAAIAAEAGRSLWPGCTYGVWAAGGPGSDLTFDTTTSTLRGARAFCSGAGIVDRALVTARVGSEVCLFDIDARAPELAYDASEWVADAFRSTRTASVRTDGLALDPDDRIGPAGFYLDRVGFWHGALAPAACWAGRDRRPDRPRGGTRAPQGLRATSRRARRRPDRDPMAAGGADHRRRERDRRAPARPERSDHPGAQLPPPSSSEPRGRPSTTCGGRWDRRPFAHDGFVIARTQQVELYVLQDHAENDLESLGREVRHPSAAR